MERWINLLWLMEVVDSVGGGLKFHDGMGWRCGWIKFHVRWGCGLMELGVEWCGGWIGMDRWINSDYFAFDTKIIVTPFREKYKSNI